LPAVSVRDLAVHGDDLIAATHGRSFWVLDGLAPLRQLDAAVVASPVHLFTPAPATRRRRGENRETPLPPETPAGSNPPAGALIDYWLGAEPAGEVTLEIFDERGERVRRFTSGDPPRRPGEAAPYPAYWLRPPGPLARRTGLNRFVWDLRYLPPPTLRPQASMDAVYGEDTPLEPEGPLVLPGTYRLLLTAGGRTSTGSLRVEQDPRVDAPAPALAAQLALARRIDAALGESHLAIQQLRELAARLAQLAAQLGAGDRDLATAVTALQRRLDELIGRERDFAEAPELEPSLTVVHGGLAALAVSVGTGDAAPTAQAAAAFAAYRAQLDRVLAAGATLRATDLPALNRRLAARGLGTIEPPP
ncbi:MAG TPA: glycoside hydrolase, partial [Thermoanaerobaculia bacterium]|nr:glycoside hydrolase [Thermoanaerobaculia bacterium]